MFILNPFPIRALRLLLVAFCVFVYPARSSAQVSNAHPDVSDDGSLIVFDSDRSGNGDIYVMNADGSGVRQLTDHPAMEMGTEWLDSGKSIAFARYQGSARPTWYVMDPDGQNVRVMEDPRMIFWARSPDGQLELVGALNDEEPSLIWVRNSDGSGRALLTSFRPGSHNSDMSFSPDGKRVIYESFVGSTAEAEIYLVDLGGGEPLRLATGTDPRWAPDGTRIAFKFHDPKTDRYWLHVMGDDGSADRVLAEGTIPRWFPDSRNLAYMAAVGNGWQIHVVDVTSGSIVRLTR